MNDVSIGVCDNSDDEESSKVSGDAIQLKKHLKHGDKKDKCD